jgi:PAS domain S-box-containing protein
MSRQSIDGDGGKLAGASLLAAALTTVMQPVWVLDCDGRIRVANPAAAATLGYSDARELLGRSGHDTAHGGESHPASECPLLRPGATESSELDRFVRRDGSALPVAYVSAPLDLPDGRGTVLAFTDTESRERVRRLADEQAALLRVATLVAEAAPPNVVFGAVASEAGALFGADFSGMLRIEDATAVSTVATWAATGDHPEVPERWTIEPGDPMTLLAETGAATRVEDWGSVPGDIARVLREVLGVACSVGCPITVEGRPWGALAIHCTQGRPLPTDTESRITQFTDLVGTAIANAESHVRADRLAEEQAALRRVATLVAQEATLEAVFARVADEVATALGDVDSALWRDNGDGTVSAVAVRGPGAAPGVSAGTRLTLDGDSVIARVLNDGRPHRIDDFSPLAGSVAERARELGMGSAVGCPIVVGSHTWGAMTVATYEAELLAPETETRVARFSDLVATAIGNADTRAEVERLAREQAALRRVATLVAQGMPSDALFNAVCAEVEALAGADACAVVRFEPSGTVTVMGTRTPARTRWGRTSSWMRTTSSPRSIEPGGLHDSTRTTRRPRTCPRSSARNGSAPGSPSRSSSRVSSGVRSRPPRAIGRSQPARNAGSPTSRS